MRGVDSQPPPVRSRRSPPPLPISLSPPPRPPHPDSAEHVSVTPIMSAISTSTTVSTDPSIVLAMPPRGAQALGRACQSLSSRQILIRSGDSQGYPRFPADAPRRWASVRILSPSLDEFGTMPGINYGPWARRLARAIRSRFQPSPRPPPFHHCRQRTTTLVGSRHRQFYLALFFLVFLRISFSIIKCIPEGWQLRDN